MLLPSLIPSNSCKANLYIARKRVCCFFTQNIFTCGHVSTQKGEGTNSRIKGNGALKKELNKSNLDRCVARTMDVNQESESLSIIKGLIMNKKVESLC